jgi:hypothetical protein
VFTDFRRTICVNRSPTEAAIVGFNSIDKSPNKPE